MKKIYHWDAARPSWESMLHRIFRDPWTDWLIIFAIAFMLAIVFSSFGAASYLDLANHLKTSVVKPPSSSLKTIDSDGLTRIINVYDARVTKRSALNAKGYVGPADPSR